MSVQSTIKAAAVAAVPAVGSRRYTAQADTVSAALAEKVNAASERLVAQAVTAGVDEATARAAFERAGLLDPKPVEAPVEVDPGQFQRLVAFARTKGFQG